MPAAGLRSRSRIIPLPFSLQGNWAGVNCGTFYVLVDGVWKIAGGPNTPKASNYYHLVDPPFIERKTCDDENHGRPPYNTGGPLTIVKTQSNGHEVQGIGTYTTQNDLLQSSFYGGFRQHKYVGGFVPTWPQYPWLGEYTDTTKIFGSTFHVPSLSGWGPVAWAKSAPKIELASGLVFAREARDIPRMLGTTSKGLHEAWKSMGGNQSTPFMTPKKASDQFLNQQFGWSPFLGDLRKFYDAYHKTNDYMDHMSKYNNRWKVYRRTLEDEISDTFLTSWQPQTAFVRPNFEPTSWAWFRPGASIRTEAREQVHSVITSSGSFKFYKPEFDRGSADYSSAWNTAMRHSAQYGLRVSPSNIWRSTPWTWLVDWGLNVGRSIDRLNEYLLDGVVSKYLYVMQHRVRSLVLTSTIPFKSGDVTISHRLIIDVKMRREADSPYGFGLSWDQLSAKRLAILAALGISRRG